MPDEDLLLDIAKPEFGSGIVGVCDICHARQAVVVLTKERFKLCVQDFLNKAWIRSTEKPGALTLPFSSTTDFVQTSSVPGGVALSVHLKPTKTAKHPMVTVVPDVFGLTTQVLEAGIRFARAGYEVVMPDIARTPGFGLPKFIMERGMRFVTGSIPVSLSRRERLFRVLDACRTVALKDESIDPSHQAVFGMSYGGALALAYAAEVPQLSAVAVAYPYSVSPASRLMTLKCPVFAMFGEKDSASSASCKKIRDAAAHWEAPIEFVVVPGASHHFLSREHSAYKVAAAEAGWREILAFLKDRLETPPKPPAPAPVPSPVAKPPAVTAPSAPKK
jgi:carboxymethylenebutenolidase